MNIKRPIIVGILFALLFLPGARAVQDRPSASSLREQLLLTMLEGFNKAGLFDQSVEMHGLATKRWGHVQDPGLKKLIDAEFDLARTVASRGTYFVGLAEKDIIGTPALRRSYLLERGKSLIINYRIVGTMKPFGEPGLLVMLFGGKDAPPHPSDAEFDLEILHKSMNASMEGGALISSVRNFKLPMEISGSDSAGGWNALIIRFEANPQGSYAGTLVFDLNGQRLFDALISKSFFDSSENAWKLWEGSTIPIVLSAPSGASRNEVRVSTRVIGG